jgi:hypothetical protein
MPSGGRLIEREPDALLRSTLQSTVSRLAECAVPLASGFLAFGSSTIGPVLLHSLRHGSALSGGHPAATPRAGRPAGFAAGTAAEEIGKRLSDGGLLATKFLHSGFGAKSRQSL